MTSATPAFRRRLALLCTILLHCVAPAPARALLQLTEIKETDMLIEKARLQQKLGDRPGALATLTRARTPLGNVPGFGAKFDRAMAVARIQSECGDYAGASTLIDFIVPGEVTAPVAGQFKGRVLALIAGIQADSGDVAGARGLAGKAPGGPEKAGILQEIAVVQARKRDFAGAKQTAGSIGDAMLKIHAVHAVARTQSDLGDAQGARATMAEMRRAFQDLPNDVFKAQVLERVVMGQLQLADPLGARETALLIPGIAPDGGNRAWCSIRPERLGEISQALAGQGDLAGARQTLGMVEGFYAPAPRNKALETLMLAQASQGEMEAARDTLNSINGSSKPGAVITYALAVAEAGDPAKARTTLLELESVSERAAALAQLGGTVGRVGRRFPGGAEEQLARTYFEEAGKLAEGITNPDQKSYALFSLVIGSAGSLGPEPARRYLGGIAGAQLKGQAEAVITASEPYWKDRAGLAALLKQANAQRTAKDPAAAATFEQAARLSESFTDPFTKTYGLRDVAEALAAGLDDRSNGMFDRATAAARGIPDAGMRVDALRDLALARFRGGDVGGARAAFAEVRTASLAIPQFWGKVSKLRDLAYRQLESRDPAARATAMAIPDVTVRTKTLKDIEAFNRPK